MLKLQFALLPLLPALVSIACVVGRHSTPPASLEPSIRNEARTQPTPVEGVSEENGLRVAGKAIPKATLEPSVRDETRTQPAPADETPEEYGLRAARKAFISFGDSVQLVPDVDGDHRADILATAPLAGLVVLISTRTYRTIWKYEGPMFTSFSADARVLGEHGLVVALTQPKGLRVIRPADNFEVFRWEGAAMSAPIRFVTTKRGVELLCDSSLWNLELGIVGAIASVPLDGSAAEILWTGPDYWKGMPRALCSLRDANDDSTPIVVFSLRDDWKGRASTSRLRGLRGVCGELLYELRGSNSGDEFGASLAAIPDLDGDGCEDFVVTTSCPWTDDTAFEVRIDPSVEPSIELRSGRTGEQLRCIRLKANAPNNGAAICLVGDLDGDAVPEVAVTARGGHVPGELSVYSIAKESLLWSIVGPTNSSMSTISFGSSVDSGHDLNGDSIPDIVVGAGCHDWEAWGAVVGDGGHVYVYSGVDGKRLHTIDGW